MKFVLRVFSTEQERRVVSCGKQIKQKTFHAGSWDEAEDIANDYLYKWNMAMHGYSLSVIKEG